jgi:hypothetical protein
MAGARTTWEMGRILDLQRLAGIRSVAQALGTAQGRQVPLIQSIRFVQSYLP